MLKFSYVMNVLNGEPFIRYQLDSIYPYADEIVIVEGAYEKFRHAATPEGRSTDKTLDIIRAYPDPQKKIKLIAKDGFYGDRLDMCNVLLEHVTGDVVWQVDADEFYRPETHIYIRHLFEKREADRVSFYFHDFFAATGYTIFGYETLGLQDVNRVHRFRPGDRWRSQRPPLLNDQSGNLKQIRRHVGGLELKDQGHVMHHATLFFEKQITDKYKYYASMWSSVSRPGTWMEDVWKKLDNKFNVACLDSAATYLQRTPSSAVPQPLLDMIKDVRDGIHPSYTLRPVDDIEAFLNSAVYPDYVRIAQKLNRLAGISLKTMPPSGEISIPSLLWDILCKLDKKTRRFALIVFLKSILRNIRNDLPPFDLS